MRSSKSEEMIRNRLEKLRNLMIQKGVQAWYINGSDSHLSEYLPARWQTRAFMSGFTGSYGWVAVTLDDAALWTDSRYFLQAEEQLRGTGIRLMKARLPETPDVTEWLISKLSANDQVGTDIECISSGVYKRMQQAFSTKQIQLVDTGDLLNEIWNNRPIFPEEKIFEHEIKYTGESRQQKIARIRTELSKKGADMQILTALDDIAWTFNLRGNDVEFNPVFLSYALIDQERTILFVCGIKLPVQLKSKLLDEGIQIKEYNAIFDHIRSISPCTTIYIDPGKTNQAIVSILPDSCQVIEGTSIPCLLKAQKNKTEIANLRNAMKKDGIAMVQFWYWLEKTIGKEKITEYDVAVRLNEFRKKQKHFKGDSFSPIVGYKEHGAIVHLRVDQKNAFEVLKEGIMLIDSGGHYFDGTTDITRTIALGKPTDQQKSDFTLALKGVIALSKAIFSEHTRGCHLDILARKALCEHGLNYGHGTSHGVGFFLNVHEGPVSIRPDLNDQTIKEGMVLSNEPGFYREGEYGVRTENMMVCVEKQTTTYGRFLGFETLTLFPVDRKMIKKKLLTEKEIRWINNYNLMVFDKLNPLLTNSLKNFLQKKTLPI